MKLTLAMVKNACNRIKDVSVYTESKDLQILVEVAEKYIKWMES